MSDQIPRGQAPDSLELRHLRAFVVVAQELNFSRAAARLFVSQSTLSRQIAALERSLGCLLLRRSTQNVALTPAGRTLLDRVPAVLDDIDDVVRATRSTGGELAEHIRRLGDQFTDLTYADVDALRAAAERHYALMPLVPEIAVTPANAGGVPGLVASPAEPGRAWVLLLHGGTYTSGSAFGFRSLAGALADAIRGRVLTPDYRLAPEHRFPAALDDVHAAYTWLLGQGAAPPDVVLAGDTSGAGLALSLLLRLKEHGESLPAGSVLFTPYVDLNAAAPTSLPDVPAPSATRQGAAWGIARYLDGHPLDDPLLDPLHADLRGLPPMLIQAAAGDEGLPDAERLAEHARAQGVDVRLEIYPVAAQSFQLYWSFLPEAADAMTQIGDFVRIVTASTGGS
ncbi:alpha/beta hydrolase fold domain-containing protein [Nonomuraea solani]|uniref:alpha/beta hydrolase fold domain-containing protein n=1 Tax=Nonomuraea solani TaxID=1144553 RepID=UPI00190EFB28|nr:alpha/beta hydrolase fold domain-containing protein [Nonomuraea solani]